MTNNDILAEDMQATRQIATTCLADLERASAQGQDRQNVLDGHVLDVLRAADGRRGRLQAMQAAHEQEAGGADTPEARQTAGCAVELCRLAIPMSSDGSSRTRSGFRQG